MKLICAPGVVVAERYDDELAERRASAGRHMGPAEGADAATAALPLQWDDNASDDEDDRSAESDERDDPGDDHEPTATTIDLTERAARSGRDDLAAWSGVLGGRPGRTARITTHPSASGERLGGGRTEPAAAGSDGFAQGYDEDFGRHDHGEAGEPGEPDQPDLGLPAGRWPHGKKKSAAGNVNPIRSGRPDEEPRPASRRGVGADLGTRVITGLVMGVVALFFLNAGTGPAVFLCAGILGLAVVELCAALRAVGYRPAVPVALLGTMGLVFGTYANGLSAYASVSALVVMGGLVWYLAQVVPARPAPGLAATLLVFGYVGGLGGFAGLVLGFDDGVGILFGIVLCVVASDVVAYLAGRRIGRRPLVAVSPNKTVEGLAAGMVASVLVGGVVASAITPWDVASGLALGLVVAVLAPLGDICESMLKRDIGVKDLGGLLPGHGGVLDRFDAFLFCLPAVYYLVRLLDLA